MKLGGTDISKIYLGNIEVSKAYLGSVQVYGGASPVLPYDAQVEYLESTGTQYIDLGFKANQNSTVEIEFMAMPTTEAIRVFGAREAWNTNCFTVSGTSSSDTTAVFGYDNVKISGNITFGNIYLNDGNWHTAKSNGRGHIQIDSTSKTNSYTSFATPYNLLLFGYNNNGTILYGKIRIRRFKFGSTMDLIPVRIGQVGYLYNVLDGRMWSNAGTGDFTLGNDIT